MIYKNKWKNTSYLLDDILMLRYTPKNLKANIISRPKSSFLYIENGRYKYTYKDSSFYANSGEFVYLPKGSQYMYEVLEKKTKCMQIEFELKHYIGGLLEDLCFSKYPVLIIQNLEIISKLIKDLIENYLNNSFFTLSILYKIIALSFNGEEFVYNLGNNHIKKIRPAIDYMEKNFAKKTSISQLAEMCNMSVSHFRRTFQCSLGISPLKFKNSLLIEYACELLKSGSVTVSEAADILGFSDIYSFSQTFKKAIGVSPRNYIKDTKLK